MWLSPISNAVYGLQHMRDSDVAHAGVELWVVASPIEHSTRTAANIRSEYHMPVR